MSRSTRAVCVAVLGTVLAGCGVTDALPGQEPLEPLHGPIDPAVLTQQAERPTPPPVTAPAGSTWRVSDVIDGRTLELFQGLERVVATLGGINVPLGDECNAQLAIDSLAFITGGNQEVDVTPPTPTSGRIIDALIRNQDGEDLALVMLTLGLARVSVTGVPDPVAYEAAEAQARRDDLGIWSGECAEESE